ncbi:MAG: neutral zinc metallopeptidase [Bacteroidota bacterium]
MKLEGKEGSKNIDDRRGRRGGGMSRGTRTAGGFGLGTLIIVIIVMLLGGDPSEYLEAANSGGAAPAPTNTAPAQSLENDSENMQIVSKTLRDTEKLWGSIFPKEYNRRYQEPIVVVFEGQTQSACGFASAATGPFYCPADNKVYIDLSFADLLRKRFRAPGDFALAYVVAHEVGHHIQNQLGYSQQVSQARRRMRKKDANAMSVRLELQADYLAGVWAHYADRYSNLLSEGDIQEGLRAASAIGDDAIQKQSQGYVVPDSFTHGTSEQRTRYFTAGYQSGDASKRALDYFFSAREL